MGSAPVPTPLRGRHGRLRDPRLGFGRLGLRLSVQPWAPRGDGAGSACGGGVGRRAGPRGRARSVGDHLGAVRPHRGRVSVGAPPWPWRDHRPPESPPCAGVALCLRGSARRSSGGRARPLVWGGAPGVQSSAHSGCSVNACWTTRPRATQHVGGAGLGPQITQAGRPLQPPPQPPPAFPLGREMETRLVHPPLP